jgi:hypothetical protein
MSGAGQPFDLQLHQALGGEADHLAQQIGVGALFQKRTKVHDLVGHRWFLESGWRRNPTLPMNHRWPTASRSLATALWMARARSRLAPPCYTTTRDPT